MENQQGREFSFKTKSTLSAQEYQKSANEKLFENQKAIQAIGNTNNVAEITLRDKLLKENNALAAGADAAQRAVDFENVLKRDGVLNGYELGRITNKEKFALKLADHNAAIVKAQTAINFANTAGENVLDRAQRESLSLSDQAFRKLMQDNIQTFQGSQADKDRAVAELNRAFDEKLATRGAAQKDTQLSIQERAQVLDDFYKKGMLGIEEAAAKAVSLGSKSKTDQIQYFSNVDRLNAYANNTLGDKTAEFEQALLDYNKTTSYEWNGQKYVVEAPALGNQLQEAIIARQENFPDLTPLNLPEGSLNRASAETVKTGQGGDDATMTKFDSAEFNQSLYTPETGINFDSPEWDRIPVNIVDEGVDYQRSTGMGEVFQRIGNYFTENMREVAGFAPMDRRGKEIVQADKDINLLREALLMEINNWTDGRVLKTTQDALRATLKDLKPGIWTSDEGAQSTLESTMEFMGKAFGDYAVVDPKYNPSGEGEFSREQILTARKRAGEIRGLIAEVRAMDKAYNIYFDSITPGGSGDRTTPLDGNLSNETRSIINQMLEANKNK
jgi:hypothetical protein